MQERIIIAALAENRVIGSGDALPWSIPDEYRHFLETIRGSTMIMGRRSYSIFGKDLTTAHNLVLSRNPFREIEGALVVRDLDAAFAKAESLGKTVFVGGGAHVYGQAIDVVDRMLLSWVRGSFVGDAFFPELREEDWIVEGTEDRGAYVLKRYRRAPTGARQIGATPSA